MNEVLAGIFGMRDWEVFADGCGRVGEVEPITVPELADGTYRVHGKSGEFLCLSRAENGTLTSIKNFFGA